MKKTILRAQWNNRQRRWRIIKKTYGAGTGSWKMFGSSEGYSDKERANESIEKLIKNYPDEYAKG